MFPGLAALVALGIAVRVVVTVLYWPGAFANPDAITYLDASQTGLFNYEERPAGYPAFLRFTRELGLDFPTTIALQHALGISTALLIYLVVRRLRGSRWTALVPTAVVMLGGDQLFYEHYVLSEALFTFLIAAAVYAAVRSVDGGGAAWAGAAGALVGGAASVRTVALFLVPVLVLWIPFATQRTRLARVGRAAAAVAGATALMLSYAVAQDRATGDFGISRTGGWSLYARVAQFADCSQFDPPAGTSGLCEATPSESRPGPTFYHHQHPSPAWRTFGPPPAGDAKLRSFARTVIVHQPLTYGRTVATDLARYVVPSAGPERPADGTTPDGLIFSRPSPEWQATAERIADSSYGDVDPRPRHLDLLADYQLTIRAHGLLLFAFLLLALTGAVVARGTRRAGIILLGAVALVLILVPPATLIYAWRYSLPATGPLAAAGALGAAAILERLRALPDQAA